MTDNKNDIPQFVACGLEMGNCPRQIPYDMAEHERIIMTELLDKVAERIKEELSEYDFWWHQEFSNGGYVGDSTHDDLIDKVIAELKAEVK